jgi:transposase
MWPLAAHVQFAREDIPYATCLIDAEWALMQPVMPPLGQAGRQRCWPLRLILGGILYAPRTGCA